MVDTPNPATTRDALPTAHRALEDDYEMGRLLGRGGMGEVYAAQNRWTHASVAVKLMRGSAAFDAERVSRFIREARTIAKIDHPSVVRVLAMGRTAPDGPLYIVQEFLDGENLRERLERQPPVTPREARAIVRPVMQALGAAHDLGVVHRDVKPENIVLARGVGGAVTPTLIDFGIAKIVGDSAEGATATGQVLGTAAYMSPEQARGQRDLDARTDVWAVGAILYELLAGRPAFAGENYNAQLAAVLTTDPIGVDAAAPGLGADVAALVHRMLARERDDRPGSMARLVETLDACKGFDSEATCALISTRTPRGSLETETSISRSGASPSSVTPLPASASIAPRTGRSAVLTASVLAAVALGAIATAANAWRITRRSSPLEQVRQDAGHATAPQAPAMIPSVRSATIPGSRHEVVPAIEPLRPAVPAVRVNTSRAAGTAAIGDAGAQAPLAARRTTPSMRGGATDEMSAVSRTAPSATASRAPSRGTNGAPLLDPLANE